MAVVSEASAVPMSNIPELRHPEISALPGAGAGGAPNNFLKHPYNDAFFSIILGYSTYLIRLLFFPSADLNQSSLWIKSGVGIYHHGAHGRLGLLCFWRQLPKPETLPALPR